MSIPVKGQEIVRMLRQFMDNNIDYVVFLNIYLCLILVGKTKMFVIHTQ